ncbi:MAG: hypothetical protein GX595_15195 [Lentisphaerae bacterium]|nr:hypothetical protein [Lentisphaerota bacterium]
MSDAILAVDAGGSKCDAVLIDLAGRLLGHGTCRQPGLGGRTPKAIAAAVGQALVTADFDTLYLVGLWNAADWAGADGTRPRRCEMVPWSEPSTALAQVGLEVGCVLLAGTGAFAHARLADGRTCHLDGFGPLLGDFGGGYHVGRLALNAVVRSDWHPRHRTILRERILERFGVAAPVGLIGLDLFGKDRSVVAALAHLVNDEAEHGDAVARSILIEAAGALAETFGDLVAVMDLAAADLTVVGTGSLIRCSDLYWQTLVGHIAAMAPRLRPCRPRQPPVVGLATLGLRQALGPSAGPAIEALRQVALPPPAAAGAAPGSAATQPMPWVPASPVEWAGSRATGAARTATTENA